MKRTFRLYNNINSSFFDLIQGDKETQQTKGLGLLLAKSEIALKCFFEIEKIKAKIGKIDFSSIDQVIVNVELVSKTTTKFRADIVIRFYHLNKPISAVIIEAKSANKNISAKSATNQLNNYISENAFEELKEFESDKIFGLTLTKYSSYLEQNNFVSITWSDIISKFFYSKYESDTLLADYFNFLTNIKGTMNFYEREVFSIPTADWSSEAINKYGIYECPNSGSHVIKQKPLFLTFRKSGGGEMEKLYKVEDIIILNFSEEYKAFMEDESYSEATKEKVKGYVEFMQIEKWKHGLPADEKQVFILSERTIDLLHKPKPPRNNSFRAYYRLSDLLDTQKKIVEKE
jgi:hypothetical protein